MNIIVKRLQEYYESKVFKKLDTQTKIFEEDPNYKFRVIHYTLVKWFDSLYVVATLTANNVYRRDRMKFINLVCVKVKEEDVCYTVNYYEDLRSGSITNCPIKKGRKVSSELRLNPKRLGNIEKQVLGGMTV